LRSVKNATLQAEEGKEGGMEDERLMSPSTWLKEGGKAKYVPITQASSHVSIEGVIGNVGFAAVEEADVDGPGGPVEVVRD
jgi:hypothetical protein